jgi:hypothetical protein
MFKFVLEFHFLQARGGDKNMRVFEAQGGTNTVGIFRTVLDASYGILVADVRDVHWRQYDWANSWRFVKFVSFRFECRKTRTGSQGREPSSPCGGSYPHLFSRSWVCAGISLPRVSADWDSWAQERGLGRRQLRLPWCGRGRGGPSRGQRGCPRRR